MVVILVCYSMNINYVKCQNNKYEVTSSHIKLEVSPQVVNGITLLPIKSVYLSFGWDVSWDSKDKTITTKNQGKKAVFKVGSNIVVMDSCLVEIEVPITIINGSAFVCSSFVAKEFGIKVVWDKINNTVIVTKNDRKDIEINGNGNVIVLADGLILNIYEPYGNDTAQDMISHADKILCSGYADGAIQKYKEILDNILEDEKPQEYAHVLGSMGDAYIILAQSKGMVYNLLKAVEFYQKALDVYSKNDIYGCQFIKNNLGNAYTYLWEATDDYRYLNLAVDIFREACNKEWVEKNIEDYAAKQYNMGRALIGLGDKNSAKSCLQSALNEYEKYIKLYSADLTPYEWSNLNMIIGSTYKLISQVYDKENNLKKSIDFFEDALKVRNIESYPMDYARIHKSLGDIYTSLWETDFKDSYLKKSIEEYNESLKFFFIENNPVNYARVNFQLGNVYIKLAKTANIIEYLLKANVVFERALEALDEADYPALAKTSEV